MGCVVAPQSATTSCTDSRQLFDRSAQREGSSAAQPMTEHHRLPGAKRRDAGGRARFFAHFLVVRQESGSPAGANTRHLREAQK